MNEMWLDAFQAWRKLQSTNEQEANDYLKVLLQHMLENFSRADASTLDKWRYGLELTLPSRQPQDWSSYNMGMAQSIVYFLQHQTSEKMRKHTISLLQPLEKKIITLLAQAPESTPTQLASWLELTRQQTSNLLRSLRSKKLVEYMEAGKRRWYSLTEAGSIAYEQFKGQEEISSTSTKKSATLTSDQDIKDIKLPSNFFHKATHKHDKHDSKKRPFTAHVSQSDEYKNHLAHPKHFLVLEEAY